MKYPRTFLITAFCAHVMLYFVSRRVGVIAQSFVALIIYLAAWIYAAIHFQAKSEKILSLVYWSAILFVVFLRALRIIADETAHDLLEPQFHFASLMIGFPVSAFAVLPAVFLVWFTIRLLIRDTGNVQPIYEEDEEQAKNGSISLSEAFQLLPVLITFVNLVWGLLAPVRIDFP